MFLESPGPMGEAAARRILAGSMLARRREPVVIHDLRSRQLPTNHNHASLCIIRCVTREYQNDSPSRKASPMGPGLSRDGPKKLNDVLRGLDGARPYQSLSQ
jgi:hypothetical protein